MKKLLLILLLLVFVGHAARCFYVNKHEVSFVVKIDEQEEKSGEEKNEKENLQLFCAHRAPICIEDIFHNYSCRPHVSPVVDHISPPPDAIV